MTVGVPEEVTRLIKNVSALQENAKYKKTWFVYVHVSKLDGRKYVGMTSQKPSKRWHKTAYSSCPYFYDEILKNGFDSFNHILLLTFTDMKKAEEAERYFINYWNTQDLAFGFNVDDGGMFSGRRLSPSGLIAVNRTLSKYAAQNARGVTVFDLSGKRLFETRTVSECAEKINCHHSVLTRPLAIKHGTVKGQYIVRYSEEVVGVDQLTPDDIRRPNEIRSRCVKVRQYTLDGKYIKTFPSFKSAAELFGGKRSLNSIYCAAINKSQSHGYMWRFAEYCPEEDIEPYVPYERTKSVDMIDADTGEILKTFSSIADAQRFLGYPGKRLITSALCGRIKCGIAYGYRWQYSNKQLAW